MAERLPKHRPRGNALTEALTSDRSTKARVAESPAPVAKVDTLSNAEWDKMLASFLERVMAQAAIGGDPKPLQAEFEAMLKVAPPGKREELEKNRGKPTATPDR